MLPATAAFGQNAHSVYIGEFGAPENGRGAKIVNQNIDNVLSVVHSRQIPWAVYWEIYCNELKKDAPPAPVNAVTSFVPTAPSTATTRQPRRTVCVSSRVAQ